MNKLTVFDIVTLVLLIIGGLNWLLIGVFNFDLVAAIFGQMSVLSRIIYSLVGLSGVYFVFVSSQLMKKS